MWHWGQTARASLLAGLACALVWTVVRHSMGSAQSDTKEAPPQQQGGDGAGGGGGSAAEKLGAGLLLTCGGEVLLLQRTSKHNHGTWGLPGGNADATDRNLLHTASREAEEEMGPSVPAFEVVAEVLTQRGKRNQKHYTVFVGRLTPEQKAAWRPALNEEHSAWRWFKLEEAQQRTDLHPVAALALQAQPHKQTVMAAVLAGQS